MNIEISKEWWENIRAKTEWPLEVYYNYYMDNKPSDYVSPSLKEFEQLFPYFMRYFGSTILGYSGKPKVVDSGSIINKIITHFDRKFQI